MHSGEFNENMSSPYFCIVTVLVMPDMYPKPPYLKNSVDSNNFFFETYIAWHDQVLTWHGQHEGKSPT